MNKRPLCLLGICLLACIWLGEMLGMTHFRNPRPSLEVETLLEKEELLTVAGQVYQFEEKESYVIYYLKQSFLVRSDQTISPKNVRVIWNKEESRYPMGTYLQVSGNMKQMEQASNPGQFDARSYYAARNVEYQMSAETVQALSESYDYIAELGYQARCRLKQSLERLVSQEKAGIFAAMLLGDKNDMDEEWKLHFQIGGISHITAISGLHLSLLGMGLFGILCRLWIPIPAAAVLSGILLSGYSFFTGGSISTMRALLMFLIMLFAKILGRTYDMLSALALAAIVALISCPASVFDCSFLLSYSAVLGIGVLLPVLDMSVNVQGKSFLKSKKVTASLKKTVLTGTKSGIAIFLVTCPVTLYFFYEISVFGTLLNLLVLPTVGVVLVSGLLGSMTGLFSFIFGKILIFPGSFLLGLYEFCCKGISKVPAATWILGQPKGWEIALYYAVLVLVFVIWKQEECIAALKGIAGGVLVVTFCLLFVWQPDTDLRITFLDVGQGDCAVVTSPEGCTYVVDGGSSDEDKVGQYRILPYLKYCGIRQVDYMLVSHTDQDHTSGLEEILYMIAENQTSLRVKYLVLPAWTGGEAMDEMQYLETLGRNAGCEILYAERGDCILEEELQWTCLHPGKNDGIDYVNQTNAGSQVWLLETLDIRALFTGDVEGDGEKILVNSLDKLDVDVLKVAHHGSKNATSEEFLEKVDAEVAVISAGKDNWYGHPAQETLERLDVVGCEVYSTQELGAIMIWIEEHKLRMEGYVG